MHQAQTTTIYVADLPVKKDQNGQPVSDVNEDFLRQLFHDQGIVQSPDAITIKTKIRQNGDPYSYGFIKFESYENAVNAINEYNYTKLNNVPIRLVLADNETKKIVKNNQGNLFIKNLDPEIEVAQLHDAFANFGDIISCIIPSDIKTVPRIDDPTQTETKYVSRGYGYIQFRNQADAEQALNDLKEATINGHKIEIQPFCRRQHANPETNFNNCYIKNFPETFKDDDIKKLFEEFGTPTSYKVITDENGISKQFGFCCMATHEEAIKAVEGLNGREIKNFVIMCGRAMSKSERSKQLQLQSEKWRNINYEKFKGRNLYIKNFDDSVTEEELKEIFSKFGEIETLRVMKDEYGNSKRFGFVCFKAPEEANKCINESSLILIRDKQIYVAVAKPKNQRIKTNLLKSQQMKNAYNLQVNNAQNMMESCPHCHANLMYNFAQTLIDLSQIANPKDIMVGTGIHPLGQFGLSYSYLNTKDILKSEIMEKYSYNTNLLRRLNDMSDEQAKELAANQELFVTWMEQQ